MEILKRSNCHVNKKRIAVLKMAKSPSKQATNCNLKKMAKFPGKQATICSLKRWKNRLVNKQ
jgi:hypothetical protein